MLDLRRSVAQFFRDHPVLWKTFQPPYRAMLDNVNELRLRVHYSGRLETSPAAGNRAIRNSILSGRPHAMGKIGSLEAETLAVHLRAEAAKAPATFPEILRRQIFTNMGIYPAFGESLDLYCRSFLDALAQVDVLAAWGNPGEADLIRRGPADRRLIRTEALQPWFFEEPWSAALAGKRVVVVHPFAETIERQYARRDRVWGGRDVLPECDLRTVRMPLSPALVAPRFPTWKEQLDEVAGRMVAEPFDVALIGAGGVSLPLAAIAKAHGGVGIHMGGWTQILFGILGRRWETNPKMSGFFNDAWTRPSAEETPTAAVQIEQGCYW